MKNLNIKAVIDAHPGITLQTLAGMYDEGADKFARKGRWWRSDDGETGQEIAEHMRAIASALRSQRV